MPTANNVPGKVTFIIQDEETGAYWSVERGWSDYLDADQWDRPLSNEDTPPGGKWMEVTTTLRPVLRPASE